MKDDLESAFVPIKDSSGKVTGMMDRATADYLASTAPDSKERKYQAVVQLLEKD